jgi:hypothetical protein
MKELNSQIEAIERQLAQIQKVHPMAKRNRQYHKDCPQPQSAMPRRSSICGEHSNVPRRVGKFQIGPCDGMALISRAGAGVVQVRQTNGDDV